MSESHWLIREALRRIALNARGPALPLARGMLEQIPQFLSTGMPIVKALRESLLIAIHTAQLRAQHCVGNERYALDDFIKTCVEMESETEYLVIV